jgi:hypothetical protein
VTRCGGVTTLATGEAALGRRKEVDDASWTNANLAGPKNEENLRDQFNYYKMNGKDLKQRGVNLFFLKTFINEI